MKVTEQNMKYLFCCDIPTAFKCWFCGSVCEIIGLTWVLVYFFLSMAVPEIAIFSVDFNVNAISYYNEQKQDKFNKEFISGGYVAWVWISLVIILGLIAIRAKQCHCFFKAQRQSTAAEELQDRWAGVEGTKWAMAAEILTLIVGIIGI